MNRQNQYKKRSIHFSFTDKRYLRAEARLKEQRDKRQKQHQNNRLIENSSTENLEISSESAHPSNESETYLENNNTQEESSMAMKSTVTSIEVSKPDKSTSKVNHRKEMLEKWKKEKIMKQKMTLNQQAPTFKIPAIPAKKQEITRKLVSGEPQGMLSISSSGKENKPKGYSNPFSEPRAYLEQKKLGTQSNRISPFAKRSPNKNAVVLKEQKSTNLSQNIKSSTSRVHACNVAIPASSNVTVRRKPFKFGCTDAAVQVEFCINKSISHAAVQSEIDLVDRGVQVNLDAGSSS